ncbi:MAG TPA: ABC transporter substrate-binding protein [Propionibacteriaceae bacterium]|jgi:peptide/nickel transport system substrate-binding protein|nr:ABC transporter substrate-binding protein [Propionibacteriaceae bacterium]
MNDPVGSPTDMADPTLASFVRGSETSRRRFLGLAAMAVGGALFGTSAAGCGTAQTGRTQEAGSQQGRAGAAGDTLFVAGFQWGPPSSFNPLAPTPAFPTAVRQPQYLYETLVRFNMLDGSLSPGLGKELQEPDKQTIVVPLQDGTKWNDGSELTAEDVAFTFGLGKTSTGLWFSNVWQYVDSITATDPRTVTFKLKTKPYNPNLVKDYIANVMIMPKAVWSAIDAKNLVKETNLKPIGSGPFKLDKADQTQVNLIRDDNYWGKTAFGETPVKVMNHPIFKSNNDGDLKLESGEIDVSQQFTAQIWKMWEKGKPVSTWKKEKPYHLPGGIPLLIPNLSKPGLDNVKVRQALAYAINYPNIATTAMSDYSEPANPSLIVPTGFESKYYDQAAVQADGWSYNKEKAVQILEGELKAKKGSDGIYELPDGTKLGGWTLITPTGWTDWNTACEIVAKSATELGIGIQTQFPQAPTMISRMQNGDFDLVMYSYTGVNAASPWVRFRDAMDDRGVAKAGQTAYYNYNRFSHPDVPGLLDQAAAATDDATRKSAIQELDKIYRAEIPVIPLMYRPLEFFEFNESNWTNFPSEANSYAPPMWQGAGISWLFKIKKVGA